MHRIEKGEYPVAALREMLLNALVHRTYMGASIQIRVFDDKLSIWNEGVLPFGYDVESLKRDHNSKPRNPIIADACFKSGYIDTWGRGTLKIINACKEAELPEPQIIEKDGGIEVTIFRGGQTDGQTDKNDSKLTERQLEVLNLIKEDNKISRNEIANKLNIAESAVQKHINPTCSN
jgi:ATP-dependent DNA helicase RecG